MGNIRKCTPVIKLSHLIPTVQVDFSSSRKFVDLLPCGTRGQCGWLACRPCF